MLAFFIAIPASRGSGGARIADVNRPRPVAINPAEISLGGDVLDDWAKESKPSVIKEVLILHICFLKNTNQATYVYARAVVCGLL